ncbi:glycosyltransferase [uncultured Aquimarina sp.]|uniref:glycosyltransferase n=1 Tax=uncultured Aquimarina sp. TaxID=575652 RepID=UPI0026149198|nr:glycosyltransferase [uncultured Aquimarina sp.]
MKKILLIMPYGSVGGMERLAFTFYNHYKNQGYVVKALKIIKLDNDIINFDEDELYLKPYDFNEMSKTERLMFYVKAPLMIRKIIKKEKFTHSIAFGDMSNIFSSLTFTKDFKIGSIHALKSVELNNPTLLNKLLRFCFKTSFKKLNKLVCISKAIKKDLIENCDYKLDNLEIIYNPHDLAEIKNKSLKCIEDRSEQELFTGNVILFLGRLSHQKSPWHLIKSFYLLQEKYKDATLVFVGDGVKEVIEYSKNLISKFKLSDKIVFLGRKSNPYQYLIKSKMLALSSLYEGTPNVIVESMSLGIPIVSSCCTDGILELMSTEDIKVFDQNVEVESGIITPNFYKGTLAIPESDEFVKEEHNFADAMYEVLKSDNFEKSLEKSKNDLLNKFDVDLVSNQYLEPINK